MNNNKKYKKWSLGLVAPALVLAPIAVVASCSSSTEEKEAYAIKFTETDQIKATIHKTVQPDQLKEDKFKEEVLEHKSDLFTIEGKLPSDSFLNDNIKITDLTPNNNAKTVSAKVTVDKANTNGEPIDKTITLTGLGYEEVDLTTLTYKISFKDELNEIALNDQSDVSVDAINADKLIGLILLDDNKTKILEIKDDASKITNEILANQILSIDGDLNKDANNGKIKFTLKVSNPENGEGDPLTKEITFTGFKKETDSTPPATEKFKIKFKAATEFTLTGVEQQSVTEFSTAEKIQPIVIKNKDKIFEAETGNLPGDDWWTEMLKISELVPNQSEGSITVKMQLDSADTTETANDSTTTITKEGIVLKGFQKEAQAPVAQETVMNAELSTVTLGLNGNRAEAKPQITQQWIFDRIAILFKQGSDLIKDVNDIVAGSIKTEDVATDSGNPIKIKFKVAANRWYDNTPAEGTTEKEFETTISGLSGAATTNTELKNKSTANDATPLSIGLVDPTLAGKTYQQYKDDSANIFTKEFVFKYRKHLLTGDFSKLDQADADTFLKDYGSNKFVTITPNDTAKTIQINFTILKEKLVGQQTAADKEYSIVFNGFKS